MKVDEGMLNKKTSLFHQILQMLWLILRSKLLIFEWSLADPQEISGPQVEKHYGV